MSHRSHRSHIPFPIPFPLLLLALLPCLLAAEVPFVRVFVLAGQSNMAGGTNPVALTGAAADVWFDNSAATQDAATLQSDWLRLRTVAEGGAGVHAGAAEVLAARFAGDRLAIVKVTQGGTGINFWNTPGQAGYERLMERIGAARARLDAQVAANTISGYAFEGFFWMQGEGEMDAYLDRGAIGYLGSLRKLLAAVEAQAATPDLPTAMGRISWLYAPEMIRPNTAAFPGTGDLRVAPAASGRPFNLNHEYVNTGIPRGRTLYQGFSLMVRSAQQFFQNEADRRGAWAESDDLPLVDYFHFNTGVTGSVELGRRMARGWMRVIGDEIPDELFVDAGPHRWAHPGTIRFEPLVNGTGGAPLSVQWEQLYAPAGASVSFASPNSLATDVTLTTPGTYALRVSVTTADRKHNDIVNVIVYPSDQNLPAYGYAEPLYVERPLQRVAIGATVVNPDSDPLSFAWQRQLGAALVTIEDPSAQNTHARFHAPGGYTLRLAIDDGTARSDGNSSGWILQPVVVGTGNGAEFDTYSARWCFDEEGFPMGEIFATDIEPINVGVATTAAAKVGAGAGAFDGSAYQQVDRTRFASSYPHGSPTALSVAAWIRPSAPASGTQVIYDQGGGNNAFTLRLHNGMLQLGARANGAALVLAETAAPAEAWTHVAAVANASDQSLRLYVNGNEVAGATDSSLSNGFGTLSDAAALGARLNSDAFNASGNGASDFYSGLLDELRVYPTALDTVTITGLALAGAIDPEAPGTILLADAAVSVAKNNAHVAIDVRRILGSFGAASVAYTTVDGSAVAGVDYSAVAGTLTWADGDTADQQLLVPILNNPAAADSRSFTLQLSSPTGAALGSPASAVVTIVSDNTPVISVQPIDAARTHVPFDLVANITGIGTVSSVWELQSGPGTLTIADPTAASTTATADRPGTYVVWLTATDSVRSNFVELIINVEYVNTPPTLNRAPDNAVAAAGQAFSLGLPSDTFVDADDATLSYSLDRPNGGPLPSWLSFDTASRTLSGTPRAIDAGTLDLRLTATDSGDASVDATFEILIYRELSLQPILDNDFESVAIGNYDGRNGSPLGDDPLLGNASGANNANAVQASAGIADSRRIASADPAARSRATFDIRAGTVEFSAYVRFEPNNDTQTGGFFGLGFALPAGADNINTYSAGGNDKLLIGLRRNSAANEVRLDALASMSTTSAINGSTGDLLSATFTVGHWYQLSFVLNFNDNPTTSAESTVTVSNLSVRDWGTDGTSGGSVVLSLAESTFNHPYGSNLDTNHAAYAFVAGNRDRGTNAIDNIRIQALSAVAEPSPFNAWAATIAWSDGDDPSPEGIVNTAGVSNLIAFALNIDPKQDTLAAMLPSLSTELPAAEPALLHLTTRQRTGEHGLQYQLFASDDLTQWDSLAIEPNVLDPDFDGDGQTRLIRYSVPLPEAMPIFLRLSIAPD